MVEEAVVVVVDVEEWIIIEIDYGDRPGGKRGWRGWATLVHLLPIPANGAHASSLGMPTIMVPSVEGGMMHHTNFWLLLALPVVVAAAPFEIASVPATPSGGVPVTVALVDQLSVPNALGLVLRRHDQTPHDVILLKTSIADGALLTSAVMVLLVAREIHGDMPPNTYVLRVSQRNGPAVWRASEERRAQRIVDRARRAVLQEIPGVGLVPAVDITLRQGALRGGLKASHRP